MSTLRVKNLQNLEGELYFSSIGGQDVSFPGNIVVQSLDSLGEIDVTGISTLRDDVNFIGDTYNIIWDKSENKLQVQTGAELTFGDSDDLKIYSDGTNAYIEEVGTGSLSIKSSTVSIKTPGNIDMGVFNPNASVDLYYSGDKKFETTTTGIDVTGHTETDTLNVSGDSTLQGNLSLGDGNILNFGDSNDLQIYHTTSAGSYISDEGTGDLNIRSSKLNIVSIGNILRAVFDTSLTGGVELYYGNADKKFETTDTGASVSGELNVSEELNVLGQANFSSTGAVVLPIGTTLERPENPVTGMFRFNTDLIKFEGYNGINWVFIAESNTEGNLDNQIGTEDLYIGDGEFDLNSL
jgi:hypothetical protein